jgi:hypothetical protein
MMKAMLGTLSGIALIAFTFLCITLAIAIRTNSKHSSELLMNVDQTTVRINKTLDKINAPGGLLQVTGKAVAKADNVLGHTDILIANEQTSLDQWNRQISATLDNVNLAVAATTANENEITKSSVETLNATTATVNALKPVMDNLVIDEQALNTATVGITAMLPDIQATAVNVKGMTADGHETTTMTKEWLHGILHPTWATRVKNAMLDVLQHLPVP